MLFAAMQTEYVWLNHLSLLLKITVSLVQGQTVSNKQYVFEFLLNALSTAFPNISRNKTGQCLENMFVKSSNLKEFKVFSIIKLLII